MYQVLQGQQEIFVKQKPHLATEEEQAYKDIFTWIGRNKIKSECALSRIFNKETSQREIASAAQNQS